MSKTRLKELTGQPPILSFKEDNTWVIPDQYVGLEIEIENFSQTQVRQHKERGEPFWVQHSDGSLRNGTEFVLSQAMMGTTLKEAIDYFFASFTKYEASPRTSIHVHLNMRQENETVEGLRNLVVLYYMFEDAFFQIADEQRKWCSYCNAFEDSPPRMLEVIMNEEMETGLMMQELKHSASVNHNRYYGLNLNALSKFGTLEFRHFPLVYEKERLIEWLNLIMELKSAANRMAEEGYYPWQVFTSPEELLRLPEYMPIFGARLLAFIDSSKAFARMSSVRSLSIREVVYRGGIGSKNKAFNKFLSTSKVADKVKTTKDRYTSQAARSSRSRPGPAQDPMPVIENYENDGQFLAAMRQWNTRQAARLRVEAAMEEPARANIEATLAALEQAPTALGDQFERRRQEEMQRLRQQVFGEGRVNNRPPRPVPTPQFWSMRDIAEPPPTVAEDAPFFESSSTANNPSDF